MINRSLFVILETINSDFFIKILFSNEKLYDLSKIDLVYVQELYFNQRLGPFSDRKASDDFLEKLCKDLNTNIFYSVTIEEFNEILLNEKDTTGVINTLKNKGVCKNSLPTGNKKFLNRFFNK